MHLQAVIVPPRAVSDAALAAAAAIPASWTAAEPDQSRGRLRRLMSARKSQTPTIDPVELRPASGSLVRLAKMGNVAADDVRALTAALGNAAVDWPSPVVHVDRIDLERDDHHFKVTAHLEGDTDGLRTLFRLFHEAAKQQRFFLDRRSFRTEFPLGTIEIPDGLSPAEEPVPHRGEEWQVTHVVFVRHSFAAEGSEEVSRIRLGGS